MLTTTGYVFVGTAIKRDDGAGWHDYVVPLDTAVTRNGGYDIRSQVIISASTQRQRDRGGGAREVTFHIAASRSKA